MTIAAFEALYAAWNGIAACTPTEVWFTTIAFGDRSNRGRKACIKQGKVAPHVAVEELLSFWNRHVCDRQGVGRSGVADQNVQTWNRLDAEVDEWLGLGVQCHGLDSKC
jgi:hypothetical protein